MWLKRVIERIQTLVRVKRYTVYTVNSLYRVRSSLQLISATVAVVAVIDCNDSCSDERTVYLPS